MSLIIGRGREVLRWIANWEGVPAGLTCQQPIMLSWPFVPDVMKKFSAEFEGEFVMHQGMKRTELKVT